MRMSGGCHRIDSFAVYAARVGYGPSPLDTAVAPDEGAAVPKATRAGVVQEQVGGRSATIPAFPADVSVGWSRPHACRFLAIPETRADLVRDAVAPPSS
ncbi:hypothetical protein BN2476_240222 [Paraburkholderia piptadeniae]|uniref:Uncharacterized protein n=1 Tax=Paraburkholderia piptadeniae TaxID=1701573 RepID=A0A1N7RZH8_9BURK|nr:hypothetical protein BN2476_240222 [Paraburkholderia piptadeniae]